MWPRCLPECPLLPHLDPSLGLQLALDTPARIYHGMNVTYVCEEGKIMADGNSSFSIPCADGQFEAPRKVKDWPKCLSICNVTDTNPVIPADRKAMFVRCFLDPISEDGNCLTPEEFHDKYSTTTSTTTR